MNMKACCKIIKVCNVVPAYQNNVDWEKENSGDKKERKWALHRMAVERKSDFTVQYFIDIFTRFIAP